MRSGSRGWGGLDLNIISRWGEVKVNFHLVRGGCDLILSLILPISQPPPPPPGNYCTVPYCLSKVLLGSQ